MSQVVLITRLNMLKKKLCFYIIRHSLWIFLDKLQEVFSVVALRHLSDPLEIAPYPDLRCSAAVLS